MEFRIFQSIESSFFIDSRDFFLNKLTLAFNILAHTKHLLIVVSFKDRDLQNLLI